MFCCCSRCCRLVISFLFSFTIHCGSILAYCINGIENHTDITLPSLTCKEVMFLLISFFVVYFTVYIHNYSAWIYIIYYNFSCWLNTVSGYRFHTSHWQTVYWTSNGFLLLLLFVLIFYIVRFIPRLMNICVSMMWLLIFAEKIIFFYSLLRLMYLKYSNLFFLCMHFKSKKFLVYEFDAKSFDSIWLRAIIIIIRFIWFDF